MPTQHLQTKMIQKSSLVDCIKLLQHQDASSWQSFSRTSPNRDTQMQRWESKLPMTIHTISNISEGRKVDVSQYRSLLWSLHVPTDHHPQLRKATASCRAQCSNITSWLATHAHAQKNANENIVQSVAFAGSIHAFLAFSCTWHHHVGSHMLGIKHKQTWIGFTNVNSKKNSHQIWSSW